MAVNKTIYEIGLKDNFSKKMQRIIDVTKQFDNQFKTATDKVAAQQKKISKGFDSIRKKSNVTASKVQANNKTLISSFSGIKGAIMGAAGAFGAYQAFSFGRDVVNLQADFESYANTLRFASGTEKEFVKNQQFLKKTINELGLDVVSATQGFGQFAANTKGTALQGEETRKIFESVSMAATVLGTSVDDTNGIFRALGQIVSKGAVQSEELRGQLGERIASAYKMAADSMGLTTTELAKQLKAGKVLSEDFLPKFSAQIKKTFEKDVGKASKSLRAQLNRLNNSFIDIKLSLAKFVVPATLSALSAFQRLFNFIKNNSEVLKQVFKPLIDFGKEAFNVVLDIFSAFKKTNGEAVTLEDTFNRIGQTLQALKPVFDLIIWVLKKSADDIKNVIKLLGLFSDWSKNILATWEGIKAAFVSGVNGLHEAFNTFINGISVACDRIKTLDFSGALTTMQNTMIAVKRIQKESGEKSGKAFKEAYESKLKGLNTGFFSPSSTSAASGTTSAGSLTTGIPPTGTPPTGGESTSLGSATSSAGTKKATNINIDINKLVENLNLKTTNLQESSEKIEESVTMALLKVLNNANSLANG